MTEIRVIADDGWVAHRERVTPADLESEHFGQQLLERLRWATEDASYRDALAARDAAPARFAGAVS